MYEFTTIDPEYNVATNEEAFEKGMNTFENLTIKNLAFRFPGKKPLLHDLSFSLHKGQIVAIAGESGQGKSTLFQVLQKFYPYDGGHILADGKELATIATPDWRKLIGVVPQDIVVFSGNLLANICLDTDPIHITRLEGFCRHYGFDRYFEKFPQSYQTMLGEGGIALSGGQKQLLALARCLYAEPQLLLLDEPTCAMDAGTEEFVIRILQKIKKEKAILVISHKDSLTEIADETYWLKGGSCSKLPVVINMEEAHV
jgi:ATP-binding cassette subfamily B protein